MGGLAATPSTAELGNDRMIGGAGNDTFVVNSIRDVLADSAGVDLVKSTISKTLAPGFEKLTLLGAAAINGTGNAAANVITGNAGNNKLNGLGGNDTLDGRQGSDILDGGIGADRLTGAAGNDTAQWRAWQRPADRRRGQRYLRGQFRRRPLVRFRRRRSGAVDRHQVAGDGV